MSSIVLAALVFGASASTITPEAPRPDPALIQLRLQLNPEFPEWSPGYVVERCAEHLAGVPVDDRPRIRYFDLSDTPRSLLPAAISSLLLGCNSASTAAAVAVPRPVPNTDNRIFWIDLAWYRWTPDIWEAVSAEDPYFREPLIPSSSVGLKYLRDQCGNAVVRASWFVYYTYDTTQFLAKGAVQADNAFYYKLIYGDKGAPKTAAEFEKFWHVDFALLKDFPVDQGAVVDEGRSEVSYQNRTIWRVRTALGAYWRTFDVFRSVGDQDFVENPFPGVFDAGEHIFQDAKGAQFYFLTDGAGKRVEFGDPRVVHDDTSGNRVVLTAASCIHCHDNGIIPIRNELVELRKQGAKLKSYGKERQQREDQFYHGNLNKLIAEDQAAYTEFVRTCNGLTPQESTTAFGRFRSWYASPVSLAQAAREVGASVEELTQALVPGTKGRLGRMILDGEPIPRSTWERGGYQEAFLLLLHYRENPKLAY